MARIYQKSHRSKLGGDLPKPWPADIKFVRIFVAFAIVLNLYSVIYNFNHFYTVAVLAMPFWTFFSTCALNTYDFVMCWSQDVVANVPHRIIKWVSLFASGSSVTVNVREFFISRPEGNKRDWRRWLAGRKAVRSTIGTRHRESKGWSGTVHFQGWFVTTAAMCDVVKAVTSKVVRRFHTARYDPLLSNVEIVNCQ